MSVLHAPVAALAWLGRQGTRAIAALVFVGIAVPPLGALLRPYVTEAIFVLLCVAFLRLEPAVLRRHLGRPAVVLAATLWTTLAIPALFGTACLLIGRDGLSSDLFLALMLQAVAPPMMAAPALAALVGLDATLVLTTLVASSALAPLTAPLFISLFVGPAVDFSPLALGMKLFAILAGSAFVGIAVRQLTGPGPISRFKQEIDGVNVLALFVFVAAVMENVAASVLASPAVAIGLAALAVAVFLGVLTLTVLLFNWAGRERAIAIGLMATLRNMGLMLAAVGGALPDLAWLYFALCQFPIYLSPQLLKAVVPRLIVQKERRLQTP